MSNSKQYRVLELLFRGLKGEDLSVHTLANEYEVSTKSVTRSINDLKAFLADHRELVGNTELVYSYSDKCYRLHMEEFLSSKELFALVEVMIGARAFSKGELTELTEKLKRFATPEDRARLSELIKRELYHYDQVKHDCESVQDRLWCLVGCINDHREISIDYYKMNRDFVTHRLRPLAVMFSDYYFYLIAARASDADARPIYFRVDRIKNITQHRVKFDTASLPDFDEGLLRRRSLFMWPGKLRTVRFEFSGPSLQAVLDKLPTAKVVSRDSGKCVIEAETYGDGIKMWLMSQGSWVKVISPDEFVNEMREEIKKCAALYAEKQPT